MKKIVLIIFFSFVSLSFFAQKVDRPDTVYTDKRIFLDAQTAYDELRFSEALTLCEKAKVARKQLILWEKTTLENSFKPAEVKKAGDSITDSIPVISERQDYEALEIIKKYKKIKGLDFFHDSKKELVNYISKISPYPEAESLIGQIYCLEGEYEIAEKYFLNAYQNADILDVNDEKYDILYYLANISYLQKNNDKYEQNLLLILAQDNAFKDDTLISAMEKTLSGTKPETMEKFFTLYRADNYRLLKAYSDLTGYYFERNKKEKALKTSALGSLTAFTKILDVIKKRNPDFNYTDLGSLFIEVTNYPDILQWGIDNDVWKLFDDFAEISYQNNNLIFAIQLFNVLKEYSPEQYWRNKADYRLKEITLKN